MKRFFTLTLIVFLLAISPSVFAADSYTEVHVTQDELHELAKKNGWDDIRQPQDAFILPIDVLAETLFTNYQTRNTAFETTEIPLRPLQEGETTLDRQAQIQQAVYQAVRAAARMDESIAYDLRAYKFNFKFWSDRVIFTFDYNYGQTYDQVLYVESEVKRIVNDIIDPSMNIHEKIKAIHDYVVKNTAYDASMNQEVNTPYHALTDQKTLCGGYSQLTYLLLKEAGIEARIISGQSQEVNHAWNLVKVNGAWYHLDTTWNDPLPDKPGRVLYTYYMLPDKAMKKTHRWKNGGINNYDRPYPRANSSYVSLLQEEGFFHTLSSLERPITKVHTADELENIALKAVDRYEPSVTVSFPYGTITKKEVNDIAAKLLDRPALIVRYSYKEAPLHYSHMNEATFYFEYENAPTLVSLEWHGIHHQVFETSINDTLPLHLIATWDNGQQRDVTKFSDVAIKQSTVVAERKGQSIHFFDEGVINVLSTYYDQTIAHQIHAQEETEWHIPEEYQPYIEETLTTTDATKEWSLAFNEPVKDESEIIIRSIDRDEEVPFKTKQVEKKGMPTLVIRPDSTWEEGKYVVFLKDIQSTQQPAQSLAYKYYFTFEVTL